MALSELKHKIELKRLEHKYELEKTKSKHEMEIKQLLATCRHVYDDGSSAKTYKGMQWDNYQACDICGKTL